MIDGRREEAELPGTRTRIKRRELVWSTGAEEGGGMGGRLESRQSHSAVRYIMQLFSR